MSPRRDEVDKSLFVYVKDVVTNRVKRMAIPVDLQVGLRDSPAELQLTGRLSLSTRDWVVKSNVDAKVDVPKSVSVVGIDVRTAPPSGLVSITLPSDPRDGQVIVVKDVSGTADVTNLVIEATGTTIDGSSSLTLSTAFGSTVLHWFSGTWRVLVPEESSGGGGGAPADATYLTLSLDPTLTKERRLNVSGSNLTLVDGGPGSTATLDLSQLLGGGAGTFANATVTADAYGRITALSAGSSGGGGLPRSESLFMVCGNSRVSRNVFQSIGAVEFTPTGPDSQAPAGSTTYSVSFQALVEVFPTGTTLVTQLYNATTHAYVSSSLMSSSATSLTKLSSPDLSGSLDSGFNTYEMHMRITNDGFGRATCKNSRLLVTWQ